MFDRPDTGWSDATETLKLTSSDGGGGDAFGDDVALGPRTLVAGTLESVGSAITQGSAYVFEQPEVVPIRRAATTAIR